jgi:hypothetical protein
VGTCDNPTAIKGDDMEAGDMRECTSAGHRNIGIGDLAQEIFHACLLKI